MVVGFVLVRAAPGHERDVHEMLGKIPAIVELHSLFGEYDLIAKVEASDFDVLGQIVVDKIRTVSGIMDTRTLMGTKL